MTDDQYLDQLADIERKNRIHLENWWAAIGQEPHYPAASDTVVRLLRAMQYRADNDTLLQFVNEQIIPPVARENGRLSWNATNIVTLGCALEARRSWQPFSQLHAHKFTLAEKLAQIAEHEGEEAFYDLSEFDVEGLLGIIISVSNDPGAVQFATEALRIKLKREGVL